MLAGHLPLVLSYCVCKSLKVLHDGSKMLNLATFQNRNMETQYRRVVHRDRFVASWCIAQHTRYVSDRRPSNPILRCSHLPAMTRVRRIVVSYSQSSTH